VCVCVCVCVCDVALSEIWFSVGCIAFNNGNSAGIYAYRSRLLAGGWTVSSHTYRGHEQVPCEHRERTLRSQNGLIRVRRVYSAI